MLVGICGAPGCGKTTVGWEMAMRMYKRGGKRKVIFLSPDIAVPAGGYIFPSPGKAYRGSLGAALDRTDITADHVIRELTFPEGKKDLALLGYRLGECAFTYPKVTADKARALFDILPEIADITVADIPDDWTDKIGSIARAECDVLVNLHGPDIRGAVYDASALGMFPRRGEGEIGAVNADMPDADLPSGDIAGLADNVRFILPYSKELRERAVRGTLSEVPAGGRFGDTMEKLCAEVEKIGNAGI